MNPIIDWKNIETVLLDMDGTILDLSFDNYFWRELLPKVYAEKNTLSLEQSRLHLTRSYAKIEGKLQWYCLDFWSEQLQINLAELKDSVREKVAYRPGAVDFLAFLQRENKKTILVTNAHPKSLEIKLLTTNFNQYFAALTSSHEYGYPKEEQDYWKKLQSHLEFNPENTLFIDDSIAILTAAKKYGIKYCYGISQPDLKQDIINTHPFEAIHDFSSLVSQ